MAKKEPKTNAMRMLERAKIPFEYIVMNVKNLLMELPSQIC